MAGLFIKLDCDFWDHPKVVQAGVMSGVLYLRMSAYCMQHTTDGFVPSAQVPRFALPASSKLTSALVDVGLIEHAEGGWFLPGYAERYPSAAEIEKRKEVDRANGRKGGRPRKRNPDETQGVSETEAKGFRDTKPRRNQEVEVEVEVEVKPPTPEVTSVASDAELVEVLGLTDRLIEALGIVGAISNEGERRIVAKARARGWTEADLLDQAHIVAARDDVDRPRAYLLRVLTRMANEEQTPTDRPRTERRPLLDDERTPCEPCGASGWVDADDGVMPCPACTGAGARP